MKTNSVNDTQICCLISNLDRNSKVLLLLGGGGLVGSSLPFDYATVIFIKRVMSSAIVKINKLQTSKLHELEAPWIKEAEK